MKEVLGSYSPEKLHIVRSLGEPVGKLWQAFQTQYTGVGEFYVASPLSSTPLPVYQWVIDRAEAFPNWEKMRFVLMDEQVTMENGNASYVSQDNPACYERFARERFLSPLQEKAPLASNVLLKPDLGSLEAFDQEIEKHGGIDLLILAIGARGHYAQVMPDTAPETGFHIAKLIPEFIEAHTQGSGPYQGASFGEYGMSLGPKQVLTAKNVVVIISGENKRQLTEELFSHDSFDPSFPFSIVHDPNIREKVKFYITDDVVEQN